MGNIPTKVHAFTTKYTFFTMYNVITIHILTKYRYRQVNMHLDMDTYGLCNFQPFCNMAAFSKCGSYIDLYVYHHFNRDKLYHNPRILHQNIIYLLFGNCGILEESAILKNGNHLGKWHYKLSDTPNDYFTEFSDIKNLYLDTKIMVLALLIAEI